MKVFCACGCFFFTILLGLSFDSTVKNSHRPYFTLPQPFFCFVLFKLSVFCYQVTQFELFLSSGFEHVAFEEFFRMLVTSYPFSFEVIMGGGGRFGRYKHQPRTTVAHMSVRTSDFTSLSCSCTAVLIFLHIVYEWERFCSFFFFSLFIEVHGESPTP